MSCPWRGRDGHRTGPPRPAAAGGCRPAGGTGTGTRPPSAPRTSGTPAPRSPPPAPRGPRSPTSRPPSWALRAGTEREGERGRDRIRQRDIDEQFVTPVFLHFILIFYPETKLLGFPRLLSNATWETLDKSLLNDYV